ncbi:MAG: hypothetical protein ACI4S9_01145 [Christensenellales bacterium]
MKKTKILLMLIAVGLVLCMIPVSGIFGTVDASSSHTFASMQNVEIAANSNPAWAVQGWDENCGGTVMAGTLADYDKVVIDLNVTQNAGNVTQVILSLFNADRTSRLGYVASNLTLVTGESKQIAVAVSDMSIDAGETRDFQARQIEFLVYGNGNEGDKIVFDVDVRFEKEASSETVATHTYFKATADIAGGSSDWIWFSNNASTVKSSKPLGAYDKVRFVIAATKADMIREVLIQVGDDSLNVHYNNWSLALTEGKNVLEFSLGELTMTGSVDFDTFYPEDIRFLLHTDKAGYTSADTTKLTAGIQFVGTEENTDFDEITYDKPASEAVATHTYFKATADITGGSSDWIWFSNNASLVKSSKPLGDYGKVRFVIAATKADMIREVLIQVGDDSLNVHYNNWAMALTEGKNVLEFSLGELSATGSVDFDSFYPEDIRFLIKTDKDGYTPDDTTKLTAGIQFVGDTENTDFDEIEYDPYNEPDLGNLTDHTFLGCNKNIAGGMSSWIWVHEGAEIHQSDYYLKRYQGVRLTFTGEKAMMIDQFVLQLQQGEATMGINMWRLTPVKGKNEYIISFDDFTKTGVDMEIFRPDQCQLLVQTQNGTDGDSGEIYFEIEFLAPKASVDYDIKLFDFNYKAGGSEVVYDPENNVYTEDRGTVIAEYSQDGGKDGASGACTITVTNNASNGQVWLTTGGRWVDQRPADVTPLDKLYFNDFGSVDLFFYVEDANYIENILFTFGTGVNCYSGARIGKAIGMIEQNGWQHLRFNLSSMNATNFDWDEENQFVSIEIVVTVRQGTPVGTKIIIDDLYFNVNECNPTIAKNEEFVPTGATGTEIDLADSVIAEHPFGDNVNVSFGIKFAKQEDGEKEVVAASGSKFTPYKAGYYFITAIATDSMGASAQVEYTIQVTGNDIDVEDPSISFGTLPSYMSKPGTLDLSVIKVTDDIDTDVEVEIVVKDSDGNALTITDNKVEITKAGVYTVTVTAEDDAGHVKTLTRKITVEGTSEPGGDNGGNGGGCRGNFAGLGLVIALGALLFIKK